MVLILSHVSTDLMRHLFRVTMRMSLQRLTSHSLWFNAALPFLRLMEHVLELYLLYVPWAYHIFGWVFTVHTLGTSHPHCPLSSYKREILSWEYVRRSAKQSVNRRKSPGVFLLWTPMLKATKFVLLKRSPKNPPLPVGCDESSDARTTLSHVSLSTLLTKLRSKKLYARFLLALGGPRRLLL